MKTVQSEIIGDLIKMSKIKGADIEKLLETALFRGFVEGDKLAKEKIIELLKKDN